MKNFILIVFLYFAINRLIKFLKDSTVNIKIVKKRLKMKKEIKRA